MPLANTAALAEAIPDARLCIIEGAGHLVFIEKAKEVNTEIVSFLKPGRWWRMREALKLQEAQKGFSSEKLKGLLQHSAELPGGWVKKLRGWLSH